MIRPTPASVLCRCFPLVGALLVSACADAKSPIEPDDDPTVSATTLVEGLNHPWSLAFLPGEADEWLITERSGDLRRVSDGKLLDTPVTGVPEVVAKGQGGLFDVVPHPDFADNRRLYISYAKACDGGATTAVGHGLYADGELAQFQDVFIADACTDTAKHFGGRILFDNDDYLFITVGDRGQRERAQDTGGHGGSVIRVNDDGSVPADNPLVEQDGAKSAIWSWGHRNPQGLALHPDTGEPWLNEHGPRGGDEINVVEAGVNYGWPVITYGNEYYGPDIGQEKKEGYAQPLHYWVPSIAPSGMAFVTGDRYPDWRGDVVSGALKLTHLNRVAFDGTEAISETRYLQARGERIRDVRQGPDGYLYLLTDAPDGKLLRVEPPS